LPPLSMATLQQATPLRSHPYGSLTPRGGWLVLNAHLSEVGIGQRLLGVRPRRRRQRVRRFLTHPTSALCAPSGRVPPPVSREGFLYEARGVLTQLTHPPRADPPSKQQVHSRVSLRRAVDAVQRCGVVRTALRAPVAVQRQRRASSLRTWRWRARRSPCPSSPTTHPPYVPRPALMTMLTETCCNV
jgi:hypothetical protein